MGATRQAQEWGAVEPTTVPADKASTRRLQTSACSAQGSCQTCIGNQYCGWCSPKGVVYQNGTVGARCADQRDELWDCPTLYQTSACVAGWACDNSTGVPTCQLTAVGQGTNFENCNSTCHHKKKKTKKPLIYSCDPKTYKCANVSEGTAGGSSKPVCDAKCHKRVPKPVVPPGLVGLWRAIQINKGFDKGEYDFDFILPNLVRISQSDKTVLAGTVQSLTPVKGAKQVWIKATGAAVYIKGIFALEGAGPITSTAKIALGSAGGSFDAVEAPPSFSAAATGNGGANQLYLAVKCLPGKNCKFTFPAAASSSVVYGRRQLFSTSSPGRDHCNQYVNCATCLAHNEECGWCTTPVKYDHMDNPTQAQCSGFDQDGNPKPAWTCGSYYKHKSCSEYACDPGTGTCKEAGVGQQGIPYTDCNTTCKPAPKIYTCDKASLTCKPVPAGTVGGTSQFNCNKTCHKEKPKYLCTNFTCTLSTRVDAVTEEKCKQSCKHIKGRKGTPSHLFGVWRGLGIGSEYTYGEWDVKFDQTNAYFKNPSGGMFTAEVLTPTDGTASVVLFAINSGPMNGQLIQAITKKAEAADCFDDDDTHTMCATIQITMAMGLPGGPAPTSFISAVATDGMHIMYLAKCARKDPSRCDFADAELFPAQN